MRLAPAPAMQLLSMRGCLLVFAFFGCVALWLRCGVESEVWKGQSCKGGRSMWHVHEGMGAAYAEQVPGAAYTA